MSQNISELITENFHHLRVGERPLFDAADLSHHFRPSQVSNRSDLIPPPQELDRLESHFDFDFDFDFDLEFDSVWQPYWRQVFEASRALHFELVDCAIIANAWIQQSIRTGQFDPKTWPTQAADFGLQKGPEQAYPHQSKELDGFNPCPKDLGLYGVAPDAKWVAKLAELGVPTVQLRFKSNDPKQVEEEIYKSAEAVQGSNALLFINDHWRLAIKANAYGVHLGQEDLEKLSFDELKLIKKSGLRLGISTHGYSEMIRADKVKPSYIAMGAVYPTTLKQMKTLPQGVHRLKVYAKLMGHYPLVAIGGIDEGNMREVISTGVGSIAMVRALIGADPAQTQIQKLNSLTQEILEQRIGF
jgi:thiamine-phosphate pyrophosphorylase